MDTHATRFERDACGTGFVSNLKNISSHEILQKGIEAVKNLTHRGAVGADGKTGDGCGVLFEIPERFFRSWLRETGEILDEQASIACGMFFLAGSAGTDGIGEVLTRLTSLPCRFRDVPVNIDALGDDSRAVMPRIIQAVMPFTGDRDELDRKLAAAARRIERMPGVNVVSLSAYSIVYKGMLVAPYLDSFYPDLRNAEFTTRYCLFHQRYSTNTTPRWHLAQPFSCLAHNGEINTITANRNAIEIARALMEHPNLPGGVSAFEPLIRHDESDSCSLDRVYRLLLAAGHSPEMVVNLLIPPAWEGIPFSSEAIRAMRQFNELLMPPWDGPAAVVFTDGKTVGAHLDRNGLRPLRFVVTEDGMIVAGSESGIVELHSPVIKRGKLGPGDTIAFRIDTGRIKGNLEILNELSISRNFIKDAARLFVTVGRLEDPPASEAPDTGLLASFGCTADETEQIIPAAARTARELTWSTGDDTPLPPLADVPTMIYRYFRQRFAQVTNPPIDPYRERTVMSLTTYLGTALNSLAPEPAAAAPAIVLASPVISSAELSDVAAAAGSRYATVTTAFPVESSLEDALRSISDAARAAVAAGASIIVLSDRGLVPGRHLHAPALLALSAARKGLRDDGALAQVSIICDTGDVRSSHELACLIGLGAHGVCPWLGMMIAGTAGDGASSLKFRESLEDGLLKIMSRMGISCVASYRDSALFDIIGLDRPFATAWFPGAECVIEGHGMADIDRTLRRHAEQASTARLQPGGMLKTRKDGEAHAWSPALVRAFGAFLASGEDDQYREFARIASDSRPFFIRHLLDFPEQRPIPIDEVESEDAILRRFSVAAMSVGALSPEAHETLGEAAGRLGMKSNSGEGGEDPNRYWTIRGSRIKQVASGRFGVTPVYLASADEIEIKVAQGAKPGEGGQLPGHKVTRYIAFLRYVQQGVTLISPPPHHDIYSIEDLAQLINDLKHANPKARICVKLVSESGIGQIASGVAKACADVIQISSAEGGTGASPWMSIRNAGGYWETGLIEAHCTLVDNYLRERVTLRVDGGFRTGRDVVMGAFLGAEEFGFGTAAMLAVGCIVCRSCHTNTCVTGIATQDDELRKRFRGSVDGVMRYFRAVARETRELLASLGYRSIDQIVGRAHLLHERSWPGFPGAASIKAAGLVADFTERHHRTCTIHRNEPAGQELNRRICDDVRANIESKEPAVRVYKIRNIDRSIPVRLSYDISMRYRTEGLPMDTIKLRFEGVAGQSFGAFNHRGVFLELVGEANDYLGKGMHGGRIVVRPVDNAPTHKNFIAGNTCLYGATGGEVFIAGSVGERFAVRNSGVKAIIEGAGHHLCEYMTGGLVVCLGTVGLNAGAGMTGGHAIVFDGESNLDQRINHGYVTLQPLNENDFGVVELLLQKHYFYTSSTRAQEMLADYSRFRGYFKKMIPKTA